MAKGKRLARPILKFEIEEAQHASRSAAEAARYLNVDPRTYRKYAEIYGIYENLLNKAGWGTDKGFAKTQKHTIKLKDVFANKHPEYPLQRLKWRMISRGIIPEECEECGFTESRVTDGKKPLILTWRNERGDYDPTNLILLCYNCVFLTRDAPAIVNQKTIRRSLTKPETIGRRDQYIDPERERVGDEPEDDLNDDEIASLKREIDRELGRG